MKKSCFVFLITLTVIFAIAWMVGLFLVKKLDIIIFSIVIFATIFIGLRYALVKIEPVSIRLMWSFLSADLFLYLCGINMLMAFAATFLVIGIYQYAPKIGKMLGFNDCKPVQDWRGTITDEGEIIGGYRYYDRNRIESSPVGILFVFYASYFVCIYAF